LLLDDAAVDLELVSSVVALDPGLAFGTLQLASPEGLPADGTSWSLPLAVVAAGRERLQELVDCASLLAAGLTGETKAQLQPLFLGSARRACVAQFLGRELGKVHPEQCYLAGLLCDLPEMVTLTAPGDPALAQVALRSALRRSVPAEVFAAIAEAPQSGERQPCSAIPAILRIASSMLEPTDGETPRQMARLAASPLWAPWNSTTLQHRILLLGRCCAVAAQAGAQVERLAPWEFANRLEQRRAWE
jgi:hypothetical protein